MTNIKQNDFVMSKQVLEGNKSVLSQFLDKLFKKSWFAGLDISSSTIKLLIISRHGAHRYQVEAFDVEPLQEGAMVEKEIKDPSLVAEAIRRLVQRSPIKISQVSVAVADSSVFTKIISMDKSLSEFEIEAQILVEAERHIPYPIEEVRFDFEVLSDGIEPNHVDVLLAVSRSETVDNYVSAVNQAGLQLKVVDVESYALLRACQIMIKAISPSKLDQLEAVFDIGANRTILTVVKNEKPIFTRDSDFSGERLIKIISQFLSISKEETIALMKQSNWVEKVNSEAIQLYIQEMVENIRRELQFFSSATQYDGVNLIILAGGSAKLPGLVENITQALQVKTLVANPFSAMSFAKHVNAQILLDNAPAFMQTCGLALRSFDA